MTSRVITRDDILTPEEEAVHAISTAALELLVARFRDQSPEVAIGGLISAVLTTAVMTLRADTAIRVLRESADDLANPASQLHVLAPTAGRH